MTRIDYVFHSHHWDAVEAQVLKMDTGSDHRPVSLRCAGRMSDEETGEPIVAPETLEAYMLQTYRVETTIAEKGI